MLPRVKEEEHSVKVADSCSTFIKVRDHHDALIRSTGHRFQDGSWTGDDDPFFKFGVTEPVELGEWRSFLGTAYYSQGVGNTEPVDPVSGFPPMHTYNFRTAVCRSFSGVSGFGEFDVPLDPVVDPLLQDEILALNALGTHWIRVSRPGNPAGTLGQWLGEMHELPRLPALFRARAKAFKDLGSDYLNVEFGWKPFMQDLIRFCLVQQEMAGRLKRLIDHNGVAVRVRPKKHEESLSSDRWDARTSKPWQLPFMEDDDGNDRLAGYYLIPPELTGTIAPLLTGSTSVTLIEQIDAIDWFKGTFVYYVPDIGSQRWSDKAQGIIHGVIPTPSVVYELMPWSWLIDWFANVGDILSNLSVNAVDNEVLSNAHVMRTKVAIRRVIVGTEWEGMDYTADGDKVFSISPGSDVVSNTVKGVLKMRSRASPFGFGLKDGDFSLRQTAILAALAISGKWFHYPWSKFIGLK